MVSSASCRAFSASVTVQTHDDNCRSLRFVVQRHQARTLHFDFRLEHEGVFKSWAVPKGIPEEIGVRRLAIQTADHALEFGEFEGEIPKGEYGAGTIEIWDSGSYEPIAWNESEITVRLHGHRVAGLYQLVRFTRKGESEWLVFRRQETGP